MSEEGYINQGFTSGMLSEFKYHRGHLFRFERCCVRKLFQCLDSGEASVGYKGSCLRAPGVRLVGGLDGATSAPMRGGDHLGNCPLRLTGKPRSRTSAAGSSRRIPSTPAPETRVSSGRGSGRVFLDVVFQ